MVGVILISRSTGHLLQRAVPPPHAQLLVWYLSDDIGANTSAASPTSTVRPALAHGSTPRRLIDSPLKHRQSQKGKETDRLPIIINFHPPGRPSAVVQGRQKFCLGRYTLMTLSFIWALVAICSWDLQPEKFGENWRITFGKLIYLEKQKDVKKGGKTGKSVQNGLF